MRRPPRGVKRDRPGWGVDVVAAIHWTWDGCHVMISGPGTPVSAAAGVEGAAVDLYWLPLGAGGRSVRLNGRVFEAAAARAARRPARDLYHSALAVRVAAARFVIEQCWSVMRTASSAALSPKVPSGSAGAARFRIFRYEIRRWRGGKIPTSARRSKAHGDYPAKKRPHSECSTSSHRYRRPCGGAMNSRRMRCGTRIL